MQNKNSHYFGGLVLSLLAMLILAVLPAAAQLAEEMTEHLSEAALNAEVQSLMSAFNQAETLSSNVNLTLDAVEISGVVTGPAGNKLSYAATIIPSLEDGQLTWLMADAEVLDASGALVENQNLGGIIRVWRQAFRNVLQAQMQTSGFKDLLISGFTSVAIDEDGLTLTFTTEAGNRREELASDSQTADNLVITEQQANDVLSAIAERSDNIYSISADFQAGQVVLDIRGSNGNGIIAILIGLFSPDTGTVRWEVSDIDTAAGVDVSKAIELHLKRFSRFVDLQIGDRPVTDFAITEDEVLISVSGGE